MNGDLPASAVTIVSAASALRHIDAARASAEWVFRVLGVVFLALFIMQPPRPEGAVILAKSAEATRSSSSSLRRATGKAPYCQACQAASLALRRAGPDSDRRGRPTTAPPDPSVLPFVHCAGCGSEHRAHLFSAEERRRRDDERICAGREGRVRLCEHVSFGWEEARRRSGRARERPTTLECLHGSHRGTAPEGSGSRSDARQGSPPPCEDRSLPKAEFWRGKSGNVIVRLTLEVHINGARYRGAGGGKTPKDSDVRARLEEVIGPALSTWWPDCGRNRRLDPAQLLDPARDCYMGRGHEEVWYSHDGGSQFLVSAGRCPRGSDADGAVVRLERTMVMQHGPWEAQWRSALDPWSWRRSEDVEMEGLSWCSETGCRSHEDDMRSGRCGLRPEDLDRPARGGMSMMPKIRVRTRC